MPQQYRVRSQENIRTANQELKTCSDSIGIRLCPLQGDEDCYGAFATRNICKGEKVLGGTFPFAVSPEQGYSQCMHCFKELVARTQVFRPGCCPSTIYCGSGCYSAAKKHYHSAVCGKDFSSILKRAQQLYGGNAEGSHCEKRGLTELGQLTGWRDKPNKTYPMVGRPLPDQTPCVMIRMLAMCVQAGGHPLEYPLVAQLMQGPPVVIERFSMNGMVIAPLRALQVLGIDIFADERYDMWVIRTIWMRIANNVAGSDHKTFPNWILGPFCWLNHSCDPNAGPGPTCGRGIDEDQVALRDIQKGEELCIKYIDVSADRATRSRLLMAWLGKECKCARCERES